MERKGPDLTPDAVKRHREQVVALLRRATGEDLNQVVEFCPRCRGERNIGSKRVGTLHLYRVQSRDPKQAVWRYFCTICDKRTR